MKTELGHILRERFPEADVQEDVFDANHYWVNVRLQGNKWITVEASRSGSP